MPTLVGLWCVAALLANAAIAVAIGRFSFGSSVVYGVSFAASVLAFIVALAHLISGAAPIAIALPLGLPGVGAQFRVDALAAFFLVVANLGGAAASFYAL